MMSAKASKWVPTFVPIHPTDHHAVAPHPPSLIRIISYNILAQAYVKSSLFPHSPSLCLRWKARSEAILERLLSFDADFLCLQELDEFESFYKCKLDKHGYSSVYVQRSGRKRDGCGIFFRRARVQLVEEQAIDYNDLVPPSPIEGDKTVPSPSADLLKDSNSRNPGSTYVDLPPKGDILVNINHSTVLLRGPEGRGDPSDPRVRLKRDCVALLAAFRLIDAPTRIFILGNTQLYWDPEWPDVKLAQACYLLSWLVKFKESIQSKSDSPPLLVITGDYNSLPGDQVYNYLTSGLEENDTSQQHTRERRRDDFEDKLLNVMPGPVQFQDSSVKHDPRMTLLRAPLPLVSLYGLVQGVHPNTNVTPGFTGPIDYIFFYPSDCLQPRSLLALPLPGAPDIQGGLPNHTHPSDHLPIGADLAVF
ncbi:hypothetical protein BDL97_03G020800 [Sphagnum fallax]|nr:hypothetical protein BDL97_03G020800 [Sphagnum fallax]